ncbi:hypothetical protein [Bacillus horti]|uniref:Uncharacterized protein n=1 Tax=Caldalkalibacillus horti TaxID=77523 RepID=A0ABT9VZ67_9BACI|nr:hypothetical protein [Bacillus horti]MDQ0165900.1 hypothetical protein [Bacillus horti]
MSLTDIPTTRPPEGVAFAVALSIALFIFFQTKPKEADLYEASRKR